MNLTKSHPAEQARPDKTSWRRWVRPVVGLVITAFFLWLVVSRLPLAELPQHFAAIERVFIVPALLCVAFGYAARIARWQWMLRAGAPRLRWRDAAGPFLMGIAANNLLPLRAGDILRLFAFKGQAGLEPSRVGGTLLVERLLDLLSLLFILMATLPLVPAGDEAILSKLSTGSAIIGGIGLVGLFALPLIQRWIVAPLMRHPRIRQSPFLAKLIGIIANLVGTILALGAPRRLLAIVGLSVIAWILEGGVFWAIGAATGLQGGWAVAYLALAIATLSTLIPSSPGYIGTFHFFAMQAAIYFGNAETKAAVFAVLVHLTLWLPTTLAGGIAFVASWIGSRRTKSLASQAHI